MSDAPLYLGAFLVVLGALIVVHELGHYLVARRCGVKVLRFSVGFGRPLWERPFGRDQTVWAIGAFPLGGYVKMLDEREDDVAAAERERAFNRQSVGKRSAIVVAGPVANFLFAILIFWVLFATGTWEPLPILGTPVAGTPAAAAGIVNGERVLRIDGAPVATLDELVWRLVRKAAEHREIQLEVINEAQEITLRRLDLSQVRDDGRGNPLEGLGLAPYRPWIPPVIGQVLPGPAERAGLQAGDRILAIDGFRVHGWRDVLTQISGSADKTLRLAIQRGEQQFEISVTPEKYKERGKTVARIHVAPVKNEKAQREMSVFMRYGFLEAGARAVLETWDKSVFSLVMLGKMLTGDVSWRNLSGPVTVADYAGKSARLGMDHYLRFMALISLSLGILNLLPIPMLDGGHLMYHALEVVRRGPLSERAMEISQQIGLSILLILMAFAFFNDFNRLFSG